MKSMMSLMVITMLSAFVGVQAYAGSCCGCGKTAVKTEPKKEGCKTESVCKTDDKAKTTEAKSEAKTEAKTEEKAKFKTLTTDEVKKLVEAKEKVVLLDARSGKWDDGKRIPGAKSLNAGSSKEDIEKVIPAKDAKIVTYCGGTTCPASEKLAKHLKELGYTDITEYPEGIKGWTSAGNSTE